MEPTIAKERGRRWWLAAFGVLVLVLVIGMLLPVRMTIPVEGASPADWHPQSFWYHPWGESGVHKGIDIFAEHGAPMLASTDGIVLFQGRLPQGGLAVLLLGAKWRIHYFAHLASTNVSSGQLVRMGERIGAVGNTGNARGKPPHVHYSVRTLVPYPWRWADAPQGWKQMFFLDPGRLITRDPAR